MYHDFPVAIRSVHVFLLQNANRVGTHYCIFKSNGKNIPLRNVLAKLWSDKSNAGEIMQGNLVLGHNITLFAYMNASLIKVKSF